MSITKLHITQPALDDIQNAIEQQYAKLLGELGPPCCKPMMCSM